MRYFLIFLVFLLPYSCAINPVTGKRDFVLMSEQEEMEMGKEADPDIIAEFGLYEDAKLQAFIDQKGREMGRISHRPNLTYTFRILDSPVVNAFALPGGYVYFTRGILAHFNNEAELAGVLGHEIGHITARHSVRQYSSQLAVQLGLAIGGAVSPKFEQFSDIASMSLGLLFLKNSREHESQSDELGVEYSTKIGYDAREMANFFNTIHRLSESSEGGQLPNFLSTHPNPLNRFERVNTLANQWQKNQQVSDLKINRDEYLSMIENMVYGEDPRQGFVEGNVYYHPNLKFQFSFPAGWELQNLASQVNIQDKKGDALVLLSLSEQKTIKQARDHFVKEFSLNVLDEKNERINGLQATSLLTLYQEESENLALSVFATFLEYDGNIYRFISLSEEKNFQRFKPSFDQVIRNFKQLTDPQKLNVKPKRIRIRTTLNTTSLNSLLEQWNIDKKLWEEIAILNGIKQEDQVSSGSRIKIFGE
jgi:predicted Zn-dependent protease